MPALSAGPIMYCMPALPIAAFALAGAAVVARVAGLAHELAPDLTVLTGDYVNASTFFAGRVTDFVRALPAPRRSRRGERGSYGMSRRPSISAASR